MPKQSLSYYEKKDLALDIERILRNVPLSDLYEVSEMSVRLRENYKIPELDDSDTEDN